MLTCKFCDKLIDKKTFIMNKGLCKTCKNKHLNVEKAEDVLMYRFNADYKSKNHYEGTEVLKNKFGIIDQEELNKMERIVSTERIQELELKPVKGNFDINHYMRIHKYIFQDIYPFAGNLRSEEINKGGQFAPSIYLKDGLDELFTSINKDNLKNTNIGDFSKKIAIYMSDLNFSHPFLEGNGRTQRQFVKDLAAKNGYKLEWEKIDKEKLLSATIEATRNLKYDNLSKLLESGISNKEPDKNLMRMFERTIDFER